jgi:hypothetical protein
MTSLKLNAEKDKIAKILQSVKLNLVGSGFGEISQIPDPAGSKSSGPGYANATLFILK